MYINFEADGTWAKELAEISQIIALSTQVEQLSSKLERTIALATSTSNSGNQNNLAQKGGKSKNGPYTVASWRLVHEGDKKTGPDGKDYYWCKDEHWSGGVAHHGMYCRHEPGKHAEWRKEMDELQEKNKKRRSQFDKDTSSSATDASKTVVNDATKKKLALSDKLRTVLTTQAGLSQEAFNRIWEESNRDSGNA